MPRILFNEEIFPRAWIKHYLCFDESTREVWVQSHLNEVPHVRAEETEIRDVPLALVSKRLLRLALDSIRNLPADIEKTIRRYSK